VGTLAVRIVTGGKLLVATAGGICVDVEKEALKSGADILVVSRAIRRVHGTDQQERD